MKKYLLVIFMVLFIFIALGGTSIYAQSINDFYMLTMFDTSNYFSILMQSEWQMDYIMPTDPLELSKGEYRVYGNAAKLNVNNIYGENIKASGTNYLVGFDTALRDDLYLSISYDFVPLQSVFEEAKDEIKIDFANLFLDYNFNKDKKIYFGYNTNNIDFKEYNENLNEFEDVSNTNINVFYLGFEIKSSFNR